VNDQQRRSKAKTIPMSKKLLKVIGKTNGEFKLIGEGDKILVGLSGGKDSLALIHAMKHIQRHAPFRFEFEACTIKYGMPDEHYEFLTKHCNEYEIKHTVYDTNIFDVSQDAIRENSSFCSYFSRMRRGALYSFAEENGFNKIALGHHFDDTVESFFMNMFYNGALRSMPPIYKSEKGLYVIRPLIEVRERQLKGFVERNNFFAIGDEMCPAMRFDIKEPYVRENMKEFVSNLEKQFPDAIKYIKASFRHIHDDTFLDKKRLRLS